MSNDTGIWLRLRLLGVVFLPAATLMALEIVSSRLLAPAFGNSVYVWGSIIGVFLAAMSVGYVAGGKLADARPRLEVLGWVLLLSAAVQGLTASIGRTTVIELGEATGGSPVGTLLAVAILFGPATAALASVSPFAVRLTGRDPLGLGGVAGRLFALSTFGSLVGTLAATFVLVPQLNLSTILAWLVSVTALGALLCFDRAVPALLALAVTVVAWIAPQLGQTSEAVRAERITPYQTLIVREEAGVRALISDGIRHGAVRIDDGGPALTYVHGAAVALLARPHARTMLGLGLGTGSAGTLLRQLRPGLEVIYAEIDPAVGDLAREWFALDSAIEVEVEDARRFLARSERTWDIVYCDTYVGQAVPFHLATREFFALLSERLSPEGIVEINIASHITQPFARAILRTVVAVFPEVDVFSLPDSGNFLIVASRSPLPPDSELEESGRQLDRRLGAARSYQRVARSRWTGEVDLSTSPILTDAFAPVDSLLDLGTRDARLPGIP
ncbi:MAG: hypothetical protein F9K16_07685 [Thermoanaerobaculia bacterium]|nr:MAG: hypothetical protein F9K16_07685 [Thermoanaerobaculia bacterium]MBZ0101202.1 fused MFS/spermidine synthase [Thermoanaerobaculia bacterium]